MSAAPLRDAADAPLRIVHTEASTGWGGQEIRILTEAAGLARRGHEVRVIAAPGARIVDEAPRFGVPIDVAPIGRKRPRGVAALVRAFERGAFDVVNTHSSTDTWLAALACRVLALRRRAAPVLVRTRHVSVPVPDDLPTRWLYRRASARVVTTGESLRDTLIRDNGLEPSRVESVPTGVDGAQFGRVAKSDARARLALPGGAPLVGIVATLRSWKGHRFLVDAMPLLRHGDARLVIVGDGPQRGALERQVDAANLRDRVVFAGQQDDVADWLAALDVFVLPSYANEGVPQALVQAMLCGLACVTTGIGAIPEAARDGETAVVVPAQDVDALAQGLARLVADPALRQRLGQAARAHCVRQFGYETMLDRMEAVFRDATVARQPA